MSKKITLLIPTYSNQDLCISDIFKLTTSLSESHDPDIIYFSSHENEMVKSQPFFDNILKELANSITHSKKNITSIDKQEIQESIRHYLKICKELNVKTLSDISTNKCIVDPLGNPISDISNIQVDVSNVNDELLTMLKKNPNYLYQLSSRKFEEVVAEILSRKGYDVTLTPATRDGGKDIYVARKDDLGSFLYLVECKKYAPNFPVGIDVIHRLYGVLSAEKSTYGIIVTTSYFTKPAQELQQEFQFRMSLKDFDSIKQWLYEVTNRL